MNNERPHCQHATAQGYAIDWRNPCRELVQAFVGKDSKSVSSRQDTQRPILGCRIIEVNA
jgi:hypothetical protein